MILTGEPKSRRKFSFDSRWLQHFLVMNVVLHDLAGSDTDFLFELYRETRRDEMAGWGWSAEQVDAFLRMQYNARQQSYKAQFPAARDSVILLDDEVIGRLLVAELAEEFRLIDIAIMPVSQGKGIGTIVIRQLLESASQAGKPVRLHVATLNPAKELYSRLGFTTIEEHGGYFLLECDAR